MPFDHTLIHPDEAILVLGSLNADQEDRYHDRSEIYPVQIIIEGAVKRLRYFSEWGELGVSSAAPISDDWHNIYLTTGDKLFQVNIGHSLKVKEVHIPKLKDVHEIALIDSVLWLANTGYDEIVGFDVNKSRILERVRLEKFRRTNRISRRINSEHTNDIQEVDRFHCNQPFKGYDGSLYALVHHASGKQLIKRIARKLKKQHGDGGVIDILTGKTYDLNLRGPHTVRKFNGTYWVFDSGNYTIMIYDKAWKLKKEVKTRGWGRGADLSLKKHLYYAGISETRKRYHEKVGTSATGNMVQIFSIEKPAAIGEIAITSGIEQINNLYIIPKDVAYYLIGACT